LCEPHPQHPHFPAPAGSVTDDTQQTLILAHLVIDQGRVDPVEFGKRLLAWSGEVGAEGRRFIGPTTLRALEALKAGRPLESLPRGGTTIGAAMRVAPLAIAFRRGEELIEQVVNSCAISHFTHTGVAGAMAMAFALAAALEPQADLGKVVEAVKEGVQIGRHYGQWSWVPPIARRVDHALTWAHELEEDEALKCFYDLLGVDLYPEQLIPCALGLVALARGQGERAMLIAANMGGDTDTLASLAGSIWGALAGVQALDGEMLERVERVNQLDLASVVDGLLRRRAQAAQDGAPAHG
jgi:ADP-ribosylglycohydrolase